MARPASPAEKARRHRLAFLMAVEKRCSLREAEEELARRELMIRDRATMQRIEAQNNSPLPKPAFPAPTGTDQPDYWWKKY